MLELKPTYRLAVILFGVAIALALFTRLYLSAADKRMRPAAATLTEPTKTGAKTLPTDLPDRTQPAAEQTSRERDGLLASAFEEMASPDQKDRNAIMAKVAMALDSRQAEAAIGAIMKELESGRDTKSGEDFVCGEEGLASASTWRVFLLDRLGRLDPRGAAEYARRVIFPSSNSAEEWAISLRHVLHSYPPMASGQGRTEISNLLARMLDRAEWRAESRGRLARSIGLYPAHAGSKQSPCGTRSLAGRARQCRDHIRSANRYRAHHGESGRLGARHVRRSGASAGGSATRDRHGSR